MNIYNYIYFKLYRNTSRVNKFCTKESTVIFFSVLLTCNILTLGYFFGNDRIINISKAAFIIIVIFNYWYFILNKNTKALSKNYSKLNVNKIFSFFIFLYPALSFVTLFIMLNMSIFLIVLFLAIYFLMEASIRI